MTNGCDFSFAKKVFVSGQIISLTGLHIGGNSMEMSIGGADSIVIRDPLTNYPYIPGSSLRGKMRSLVERHRGEMTIKFTDKRQIHRVAELSPLLAGNAQIDSAGPATDSESACAQLFGVAIDAQEALPIPQRLVVRDAYLTEKGLEKLESARNLDMPLTEVKTEVNIDRITSKANPRQIERVPAGAEFAFEFILNLYGQDNEKEMLDLLWECMMLLQDDYLGGHGSRGYGKVKFSVDKVEEKTAENYRNGQQRQPMEVQIPQALKD
jgi:CRISPR-associated protein Csm3